MRIRLRARARIDRSGFTLVEMLVATVIVGIVMTIALLSFNAVTTGWEESNAYIDRNQRSDYALDQVTAALRSMYYPHTGEQSYDYGFILTDNGEGEDPSSSDVIEFTKLGSALIGSRTAGDTVHRVQIMVLEEGKRAYDETVEKTGLYVRMCKDKQLNPTDDREIDDFTLGNEELYKPVLLVPGVKGFNCRVQKSADQSSDEKENDKKTFEDEWSSSNSVPYKVELTFRTTDTDSASYEHQDTIAMRIVRIPVHEQSNDGAKLPSDEASQKDPRAGGSGSGNGGKTGGGNSTTAPTGTGGAGRGGSTGGGTAPAGGGGGAGAGGGAPAGGGPAL